MSPGLIYSKWKDSEKVFAVTIVVVLLFFANIVVDQILLWKNVQAAETLLNDVAIAAVGGFAVWVLLTVQAKRQEMLKARERMQLTIELNHHVRNAFSMMASSLLLRNEEDRLRVIDDAMQEIDRVLTEVVPAGGNTPKAASSLKSVNPSYPAPYQPGATRQN